MSTGEATGTKLRRDARRSIEKLTAAAVEAFQERGLGCPLEEIARRAGVSPGTVYNRFGSREKFIDAVVPDLAAAKLGAAVRHAAEGDDAWARFERYVEGISSLMAHDQALADVITRRYADTPRLSAVCEESFERGREFVEEAQRDGGLRADFTSQDLLLLFLACTAQARATASTGSEVWRRGLAFTLDGLRSPSPRPLPVGPLTPEQAHEAMYSVAGPRHR
jgi:AcrR family transcriptional regulator